MSYLSIYDQYFPKSQGAKLPENWNAFKSSESDLTTSSHPADFSVPETWAETARRIATITLKIILLSCALYPFMGHPIARLAPYVPSTIQSRTAQFLQSEIIVKILAGQANFTNKVLSETAKRSATLALRALLSVWSLRYVVQRLAMIPLYPAQSRIAKFFQGVLGTKVLDYLRNDSATDLNRVGYIVRHVLLERKGVPYSGMLIGHKDTISNGKWVLQATGNAEPIEHSAEDFATTYKNFGYNTLLVNGPSVGRSEGHATPQSMGEAQETGLRFLEEAVNAHKIVMAGRSLGGAAIAQAILQHEFKEDIKYLVVQQMTFDRSSNVGGKILAEGILLLGGLVSNLVSKIIRLIGCEMDSVAASKKLQTLGIKEIIVQATRKEIEAGKTPAYTDFRHDGVIPAEASLGYALVKEGVTENKLFLGLKYTDHCHLGLLRWLDQKLKNSNSQDFAV